MTILYALLVLLVAMLVTCTTITSLYDLTIWLFTSHILKTKDTTPVLFQPR